MKCYSEYEKQTMLTDIAEIKEENREQLLAIAQICMISYFKSLVVYGVKNKVTKDNINVFREFWKIIREETRLLSYIEKNISEINVDAFDKYIERLDALNDKTILYYYNVIEDIETACETKNPLFAVRMPKDFKSLTDTSTYRKEVVALTENDQTIREQLKYEEDFWEYIDLVVKRVNVSIDVLSEVVYVKPIYDSDDLIGGIDLLVPEVVDLPSALLTVELYEKAYRIYKSFGCRNIISSQEVELSDIYSDYYLDGKVQLTFDKK